MDLHEYVSNFGSRLFDSKNRLALLGGSDGPGKYPYPTLQLP